jgi:hypothetical protein
MTDNRLRLKKCIIANFTLLILMIVIISIFKEPDDKYLKIGPNENLIVMSVKINTITKYIVLQIFLAITEIIRCVVNEIASPILGFNIYNPDKKIITEFTKNELQIMANSMWLIKSLISALSILVTISQLDIAILKVIYSELTAVYTIRVLLNEKEFIQQNKSEIELEVCEKENLIDSFV